MNKNNIQVLKNFTIIFLLCFLNGCSHKNNNYSTLNKDNAILAIGDSLTYGYGSNGVENYPNILKDMLINKNINVINSGVNGDTSEGVLERINDNINKNKPNLIILSIGGNDMLRKINKNTTIDNIQRIINVSKNNKVPIILVAVPEPTLGGALVGLSDANFYEDLAKKNDLIIISKAWSRILSDNTLKSDTIHANNAGYRKFAEIVYDVLEKNKII